MQEVKNPDRRQIVRQNSSYETSLKQVDYEVNYIGSFISSSKTQFKWKLVKHDKSIILI